MSIFTLTETWVRLKAPLAFPLKTQRDNIHKNTDNYTLQNLGNRKTCYFFVIYSK